MFRHRQNEQAYTPVPDYLTDFPKNSDESTRRSRKSAAERARIILPYLSPLVALMVAGVPTGIKFVSGLAENSSGPAPTAAGGSGWGNSSECSTCVSPNDNTNYGTTWVWGASVDYGEGAWSNIHAFQNGKPYRGVLAIRIPGDTTEFVEPQVSDKRPTNDYLTKLPIEEEPLQFAMAASPSSVEIVTGAFSRPQQVDVELGARNSFAVSVSSRVTWQGPW